MTGQGAPRWNVVSEFVRVFPDELSIWIGEFSKAGWPPHCVWASSNLLGAWIEQEVEEGGILPFFVSSLPAWAGTLVFWPWTGIHTHMCTYMHTHIHTHTHIYTPIYVYTHTQWIGFGSLENPNMTPFLWKVPLPTQSYFPSELTNYSFSTSVFFCVLGFLFFLFHCFPSTCHFKDHLYAYDSLNAYLFILKLCFSFCFFSLLYFWMINLYLYRCNICNSWCPLDGPPAPHCPTSTLLLSLPLPSFPWMVPQSTHSVIQATDSLFPNIPSHQILQTEAWWSSSPL